MCAAVQLPCHHHYHQSELQSCLSVRLGVFAADNGDASPLILPPTSLLAIFAILRTEQDPLPSRGASVLPQVSLQVKVHSQLQVPKTDPSLTKLTAEKGLTLHTGLRRVRACFDHI